MSTKYWSGPTIAYHRGQNPGNNTAMYTSAQQGTVHNRTIQYSAVQCNTVHKRHVHINLDSFQIRPIHLRLIQIESESHSHEQISSCNHGACYTCDASVGSYKLYGCSTLHVYQFHPLKKCFDILFWLQYQEVFQSAHQTSAECKHCK